MIIINSKNGADNIRLSKLATREENLIEDELKWKILKDYPCNDYHPILIQSSKSKSGRMIQDKSYDKVKRAGNTITKLIIRLWATKYNVIKESDVEPWMISKAVTKILNSDSDNDIQLAFCRDPSRQAIDEYVQRATLEKYLIGAIISKPTNGSLTLTDGDLIRKPQDNKGNARSIDFVVNYLNKEFNIFAKSAAVSGSGQSHQMNEGLFWIREAKKYIDKNQDGKYFIVLVDGEEAERHIDSMRELIVNYPNIFVGNCENVIDHILNTAPMEPINIT